MEHSLVALHAALGEIGTFAFLWIFVELLDPNEKRLQRAQRAALIGVTFLVLSWLVGGYYYVVDYGAEVKPVIIEGPLPGAHAVFMEAKEHIFIFLPFLAIYTFGVLRNAKQAILTDTPTRKSVLVLSAIIFLTGMSMAGMGYFVSMGARMALLDGVGI